jgi:hypothetical protein
MEGAQGLLHKLLSATTPPAAAMTKAYNLVDTLLASAAKCWHEKNHN